MTTRRKASEGIVVSEEAPEDDTPHSAELQQAEAEQVQEEERDLLMGLRELSGSGEIRWQIWRLSVEPGKGGYVTTLNTSQLNVDYIAQKFGGGRYKIRGTYPNGQFAAQRTMDIVEDTPRLNAMNAAPASGSIQDVLLLMEAKANAARSERNENIKFWAGILSPLLIPILPKLIGGRESMSDMVQGLAALQQLNGGTKQGDNFDQITKVMEFVNGLKSEAGGGGETNWLDVLRDGVKAFGPAAAAALEKLPSVIAAQNAQRRLPSPGAPASTGSELIPANRSTPIVSADSSESRVSSPTMDPSPSISDGSNMLSLLPWLKHQIQFLMLKAARKSDPVLYADYLLDNLPDNVDPVQLVGFLARENWWEMLSSFVPDVHPYHAWFTELRAALLEDDGQELPAAGGERGATIEVTAEAEKPAAVVFTVPDLSNPNQ